MSMSFFPPSYGDGGPDSPLQEAESKIHAEEAFADRGNLGREIRREQGGGVVRRTLRRWLGRPLPGDPPSAAGDAGN